MQYLGRAYDSVSKTWSSINPATLSGAIDIIVVENDQGDLNCSPFHVRFGKFQLLRPSQKKVDFYINGKLTNLPMKLGDGGEAFFVFETSKGVSVPKDLITSPVLSAMSSPGSSPPSSPEQGVSRKSTNNKLQEPEFLDISTDAVVNGITTHGQQLSLSQSQPELSQSPSTTTQSLKIPQSANNNNTSNFSLATSPKDAATLEKFQNLTRKLTKINIPTKIDNNGDLFLDMNGYKSNDQNTHDSDEVIKELIAEEFGKNVDLKDLVHQDDEGNIKIFSMDDLNSIIGEIQHQEELSPSSESEISSMVSSDQLNTDSTTNSDSSTNYVKTLRLTSDQLRCLDLKPGENDISFSVDKGKAIISSKLYLWKQNVPIVISDIDGTITKSDALGHVLTMLGRDWTHPGVAKLFEDISLNGYNVMYLTARSVGQADSTRSYLRGIEQDGGIKIPNGPVILSPDRTIAALKREVILRKPEVFKMACLKDIMNLYGTGSTPFYAGFGNRITDALSYRSVSIPSSRIFTINPEGEVHMELLEMAGYKSSYVNINELVDHFFPPVDFTAATNNYFNDENFTDVNYWRESIPQLISESEDEEETGSANASSAADNTADRSYMSAGRLTLDDIAEDYNSEDDEDYDPTGEIDGEDEEDDYYDDDNDNDFVQEQNEDDFDEEEYTDESEDGSMEGEEDEEEEEDDIDEIDDFDSEFTNTTPSDAITNNEDKQYSPTILSAQFTNTGNKSQPTSSLLSNDSAMGNFITANEFMKEHEEEHQPEEK